MSEVKGQLLGIIMTIAIFGIVFAAMVTAFTTASNSVSTKVKDAATTSTPAAAVDLVNPAYTLHY